MYESIYALIVSTINGFNDDLENKIDLSNGVDTELFGGESPLDSLELVNLIVAIEENIAVMLNKNITITSEKAMSQKVSPFKTVGSLTMYVIDLLNE